MNTLPDPDRLHPSTRPELRNVVFLKNEVTSPLIDVGDYTYYDDEGHRPPFEQANVTYLYGPQRLVIGCFTAIGDGAVIGAHSVVTGSIDFYEVVAGNPARHLRSRFTPVDIERLLAIRWWDWPVEMITEHAALIMAGTPDDLERVAGS